MVGCCLVSLEVERCALRSDLAPGENTSLGMARFGVEASSCGKWSLEQSGFPSNSFHTFLLQPGLCVLVETFAH